MGYYITDELYETTEKYVKRNSGGMVLDFANRIVKEARHIDIKDFEELNKLNEFHKELENASNDEWLKRFYK